MLDQTVLVAIGANLPDRQGRPPAETCRRAVAEVAARTGLPLLACSRWYRSAPVPPSGQPDYVNGVARYGGRPDPHALLAILHAIEAEAGRRRTVANAARPLDLDLLLVGSHRSDSPRLTLPHPRMALRAFVLAPLAEVAPDWTDPAGTDAATLLAALGPAGISLLDPQ